MPPASATVTARTCSLKLRVMRLDLVAIVVDDFDAGYRRMVDAGVTFLGRPRTEGYGRVAVFLDIAGNKWDLLG